MHRSYIGYYNNPPRGLQAVKTNLKTHVYQHIRAKLLSRELMPGASISHRALAKEIGVSFTPVREAIGQLASEGLLVCHPSRGTFVSTLSRQDIAELYEIREAQESYAVAKIANSFVDEGDLQEMERHTDEMVWITEQIHQAGNPVWDIDLADRWVMADAGFHMTVLRAAGNRRALKIVSELRVMAQIFGQRKQERPQDDLDLICQQHRSIIAALREGDSETARKVMIDHIHRGCETAIAAYDRNRIKEASGQGSSVTYPFELQERIHEMEQNSGESA